MMSMVISINGRPQITLQARRMDDLGGVDEVYEYQASDGRIVTHRYSDGLAALAIKLLEPMAKQDAQHRYERITRAALCSPMGRVMA